VLGLHGFAGEDIKDFGGVEGLPCVFIEAAAGDEPAPLGETAPSSPCTSGLGLMRCGVMAAHALPTPRTLLELAVSSPLV